MTCACGSGEHHWQGGPCVRFLADRIAKLEAKSAVPNQSAPKLDGESERLRVDLATARAEVEDWRRKDQLALGLAVEAANGVAPARLPAPKLDRPLASGWYRSNFDTTACCTWRDHYPRNIGTAKYETVREGACEAHAESMGVFAPLAPAESSGVPAVEYVDTACPKCNRPVATSSTKLGPTQIGANVLCWAGVIDLGWARHECANIASQGRAWGADKGRPAPPVPAESTPLTVRIDSVTGEPLFEPSPVPSVAAPTCKDWCGLPYQNHRVPTNDLSEHPGRETVPPFNPPDFGGDEGNPPSFCTAACRDAGKPLNPATDKDSLTAAQPQPPAAPDVATLEAALAQTPSQTELAADRRARMPTRAGLGQPMSEPPKPAAAPAPGGTNRERACRFYGCTGDDHPHWPGCPDLVKLLDEIERDAESRGRHAAHGEAAKKWRKLSESDRHYVLASIATTARDRDEVADVTVEQAARGCREDAKVHRIARAALAELAGGK